METECVACSFAPKMQPQVGAEEARAMFDDYLGRLREKAAAKAAAREREAAEEAERERDRCGRRVGAAMRWRVHAVCACVRTVLCGWLCARPCVIA